MVRYGSHDEKDDDKKGTAKEEAKDLAFLTQGSIYMMMAKKGVDVAAHLNQYEVPSTGFVKMTNPLDEDEGDAFAPPPAPDVVMMGGAQTAKTTVTEGSNDQME
jgi:hypothetical protein